MTDSQEVGQTMFDWQRENPQDEQGGWTWGERLRLRVASAYNNYTRLEGLREAYYTGVESRNCEGMIPNDYPKDDPKHQAWRAGYRLGLEIWGSDEP